MIVVHHLNDSRSQRVLWLLEELELPYEVAHYQRNPKTLLAPAELRSIHPLGKAPVLEDGAVRVAETGAIVDHLIEAHGQGRLRPERGTEEARRYVYWTHYAEGSAMPPLLLNLVFAQLPKRVPALIRPLVRSISEKTQTSFVDPQIATHADFWEASLAASGWFAGDSFTAADVMMSFPVETAAARALDLARYPNLATFLKAIHARPAYQRALERGGAYAYA